MAGPETPDATGASPLKTAIRDWWSECPMTYADTHGGTEYRDADGRLIAVLPGSREFFAKADEIFYRWNEPLHVGSRRFARLFDYDRHAGCQVLEVGCGMGAMAMNWAMAGARVTAVDLNPVAVAMTRRRFELFNLNGTIIEADGETLPFADGQFDFAYSWGVLHHTPGTRRAIAELIRVLKPGGGVGVMLYHRHSLLYWYGIRYIEGFLNMERLFLNARQLASRYTDGARQEGNPYTWPVTQREAMEDMFALTEDVHIRVLGTDVVPILEQWASRLGSGDLPLSGVKALARRWGWSLWITAVKSAD